jgi:hypothetical protein
MAAKIAALQIFVSDLVSLSRQDDVNRIKARSGSGAVRRVGRKRSTPKAFARHGGQAEQAPNTEGRGNIRFSYSCSI